MSFNSSDISVFFPAGAGPDSLRVNNLGGAISATQIQSSLMWNFVVDIPRSVIGNVGSPPGQWSMYMCYYVKNSNTTTGVNNLSQWIYKPPTNPNIGVQIGKDPAGVNGTAQTIPNQTTKPTGITFSSINTETVDQNTLISALDHDQYFPMWCRVYGNKGIASIPVVTFGIKGKYFVNQAPSV